MANLENFIDKLVNKVLNEELDRKINTIVESINEKEEKWIQDVDMKKGAFTKYCGGEVTCDCAKKALDKGGNPAKMAQLYLNMNKDKCKSLQESMGETDLDEMEDNYNLAQKRRKEREMKNTMGNKDYIKNMPNDDLIGVYSDNSSEDGLELGEEETMESNAFVLAADAAKDAGKGEFEFPEGSGKMHKVTIKKDIKTESKKRVLTLSEEQMIELIEKIIEEEFVSGDKETKDSLSASKKENNENLKAVAKKMKDYLKDGSEGTYEPNPKTFPQGNGDIKKSKKMAYQPSKAVEEYIENFAYSPGMENLQYDEISPNEEWVEMNIEGNSKTGNSPEYANAVETPLGKAINNKRKKNLYGKEKDRSYNRVKQPVDVTGNSQSEDALDKMFKSLKSESVEKKSGTINEEMEKMKKLISYSQKTQ